MEILKAKKREIIGKKVKSLRRKGLIPAVVYGKNITSEPLILDPKEFNDVYRKSGESTLIDLVVEGESQKKVLISQVQRDPVTDIPIHVDLRQVDLKEKITAEVPIEIVGESPIVHSGQGILLTLIDEVEVTCLPTKLPSQIKVDISNLTEIGDTLHIKDLPVDRKTIEVNADPEKPILKIDYPEMMEEEEEEKVIEEEAVAGVTVEKEKEEEEEKEKVEEKVEGKKAEK